MPRSRRSSRLLVVEPPAAESRATVLLEHAIVLEREARGDEACSVLSAAIEHARIDKDYAVLAKALRRLAVFQHLRCDPGSRSLCRESFEVAMQLGDRRLAAEAANTTGAFAFEVGEMEAASDAYQRALSLADGVAELEGRIEQNLGILANVRGDLTGALAHYRRSLARFTAIENKSGCAIAYHNLGMISADQELWDDAEAYYRESQAIAAQIGDLHLQALCKLNHAEVCIARARHEEARAEAEYALRVFGDTGALAFQADAYKLLGVVYRETGRPVLAEARFARAIELARASGSLLSEAETSRELAVLFHQLKRNQEALRLLNASHRLFQRLDARVDLGDVSGKVAQLEGTYLDVVRDWAQSIESSDTYTFGHCERVATFALMLARRLGLDDESQTTIRLGAYLHDLGKVRVPHEILNKPGRLTAEEMAVIQRHPIDGVDMLEGVEFPWDLKPIIRWHHEKADGSGYPDHLAGEQIPLHAQIICIVDVYDALISTRSYRPAMPRERALEIINEHRHWWRPEIVAAFMSSVGSPDEVTEAPAAVSPNAGTLTLGRAA